MPYFITPEGFYYHGDKLDRSHREVSPRPSPEHVWGGEAWVLDQAKVQERLEGAVQKHLDSEAQKLGYDSVFTATTYAASAHPKFGKEGKAFLNWRDAVWDKCYALLAEVQAGTRAIPTEDELLAELPALQL